MTCQSRNDIILTVILALISNAEILLLSLDSTQIYFFMHLREKKSGSSNSGFQPGNHLHEHLSDNLMLPRRLGTRKNLKTQRKLCSLKKNESPFFTYLFSLSIISKLSESRKLLHLKMLHESLKKKTRCRTTGILSS